MNSFIGVPLIAINPFQNVDELYDEKMVQKYKRGSQLEIKVCDPKTTSLYNGYVYLWY